MPGETITSPVDPKTQAASSTTTEEKSSTAPKEVAQQIPTQGASTAVTTPDVVGNEALRNAALPGNLPTNSSAIPSLAQAEQKQPPAAMSGDASQSSSPDVGAGAGATIAKAPPANAPTSQDNRPPVDPVRQAATSIPVSQPWYAPADASASENSAQAASGIVRMTTAPVSEPTPLPAAQTSVGPQSAASGWQPTSPEAEEAEAKRQQALTNRFRAGQLGYILRLEARTEGFYPVYEALRKELSRGYIGDIIARSHGPVSNEFGEPPITYALDLAKANVESILNTYAAREQNDRYSRVPIVREVLAEQPDAAWHASTAARDAVRTAPQMNVASERVHEPAPRITTAQRLSQFVKRPFRRSEPAASGTIVGTESKERKRDRRAPVPIRDEGEILRRTARAQPQQTSEPTVAAAAKIRQRPPR